MIVFAPGDVNMLLAKRLGGLGSRCHASSSMRGFRGLNCWTTSNSLGSDLACHVRSRAWRRSVAIFLVVLGANPAKLESKLLWGYRPRNFIAAVLAWQGILNDCITRGLHFTAPRNDNSRFQLGFKASSVLPCCIEQSSTAYCPALPGTCLRLHEGNAWRINTS